MNEEWKQRISAGRKKFLNENPDQHPWKRKDKFKSKPCEALKSYLKSKGLVFVEEWQPIKDRFYSLDIAFPDIKLGIEVNGNQHYDRNGKLKTYYQERHDLICSTGWKLIELHYVSCYNLEQIDLILDIKTQPDYSQYFLELAERKKRKIRTLLPPGQFVKQLADARWEPFKEKVLNSDIRFSKHGWVQQVAKILNIKPQKVNRWMKRYLPDVYELQCFKRNGSIV